MRWVTYLLTGALILFAGYLAFWPEEASPPGQATIEPGSTVPSVSPEEAAKRFADRQPGCVEVIRVERISDARALFRIECAHVEGGTFTLQFASSGEAVQDPQRRP